MYAANMSSCFKRVASIYNSVTQSFNHSLSYDRDRNNTTVETIKAITEER